MISPCGLQTMLTTKTMLSKHPPNMDMVNITTGFVDEGYIVRADQGNVTFDLDPSVINGDCKADISSDKAETTQVSLFRSKLVISNITNTLTVNITCVNPALQSSSRVYTVECGAVPLWNGVFRVDVLPPSPFQTQQQRVPHNSIVTVSLFLITP